MQFLLVWRCYTRHTHSCPLRRGNRSKKMASVLSKKHFHNEDEAFAYVEARVWPEGPVCPHCGGVERITGQSRFFHVDKGGAQIHSIVLGNLAREARLMTDEHTMYKKIGREFAEHSAVHHYNKEYVRGDVTTNTVEGAFSIFKRGMRGVYQHCREKHLHRYLAEFEFRYSHREATGSNDADRADAMLRDIIGKRL